MAWRSYAAELLEPGVERRGGVGLRVGAVAARDRARAATAIGQRSTT